MAPLAATSTRGALFYLRSRGLPRTAAESVLTFAFAAEVIDRFADPTVRQHVRAGCDRAPARRVGRWRSWHDRGCRPGGTPRAYDVARVRRDFPILATRMNGRPLVYLDTAASAQKPRAVIDTLKRFYEQDYANIHRGVYDLSQRATAADDAARRKVQRFVNAADWREIVFTRNATEAINLVAPAFSAHGFSRATRSWSPRWSTTPTSCPGRWRPRLPAPRWWRHR